jgi:hypothetical protein
MLPQHALDAEPVFYYNKHGFCWQNIPATLHWWKLQRSIYSGKLDALGGEIGRAADPTHCKAVCQPRQRARRSQSARSDDRRRYSAFMKHTLERQENLELRQLKLLIS